MSDRLEVIVDLDQMVNTIRAKSASRTRKRAAASATPATAESKTEVPVSNEAPTSSDIRKCGHGVYWPEKQLIAEDCQLCNPNGNPDRGEATTPHFNRRSSLTMSSTGKLPNCPSCGTILTVSNGGKCLVCHGEYIIDAPEKLRANNRVPGVCPECGAGVHFELNSKEWQCAECDTVYKAPKQK